MDIWRFDPTDYKVGDHLFIADFGFHHRVTAYLVDKITPKGQISASRNGVTVRVNSRGNIIGSDRWNRRGVVSADRAREIREETAERDLWIKIRDLGTAIEKAARNHSVDDLVVTLAKIKELIGNLPEPPASGTGS